MARDAMGDIDSPIRVDDLPECHLFRLIHRAYLPDNGVPWQPGQPSQDRFADLRRPVDWGAVLTRLGNSEGRDEARQWVRTGRSTSRLFLHQLCDFDFGRACDGSPHDRISALAIDGPTGMIILRKAVDVFPGAVRLPDGEGCYPLHIVCDRNLHLEDSGGSASLSWRQETRDVFQLVYDLYPEAASKINPRDNSTALHHVLESGNAHGEEEVVEEYIFRFLLDVIPWALQIRDSYDRYPLHLACHFFPKLSVIKTILQKFPKAAQLPCEEGPWGGRTPLLTYLRCCETMNAEHAEVVEMLLLASPWAAAVEDKAVLMLWQYIDPAGDALDYMSVNFCNIAGANFWKHDVHIAEDTDEDVPTPYRSGYIAANAEVEVTVIVEDNDDSNGESSAENLTVNARMEEESAGRSWGLFLTILRVMYGRERFLPLHAAVQGSLCRPWNVLVMKNLLQHFRQEIREVDSEGHLPLHLFLMSCFIERDKAIAKGYAANFEDYDKAVTLCFQLLLNAYPNAATMSSGEGRLPLHLAVESCSHVAFEAIIEPLLQHAPRALLCRDMNTRLYPFALAAIGASANLDLSFVLLRKEPSVMMRLA